jgi:hypothetical protein
LQLASKYKTPINCLIVSFDSDYYKYYNILVHGVTLNYVAWQLQYNFFLKQHDQGFFLLLFERQKHKNYKHYKNYESILIEG